MHKNNRSGSKGGDERHKFVQTLVDSEAHKALKMLALERDCTLAFLLRSIIETFINKESSHGRSRSYTKKT